MITQAEIQDFFEHVNALLPFLNEQKLRAEQKSLQIALEEPDIWENPIQAKSINIQLARIDEQIEQINAIKQSVEDLQTSIELGDEGLTDKAYTDAYTIYQKLNNERYLNGRFDSMGALLSVHAGAGGIDAQDFAAMLLAMYQTFSKNQGFSLQLVSISSGEEGGTKSALVEIKGTNAYGLLKEEAGVHRLVRISPFNSGGTRETSFALVEVIPDEIESSIEPIVIDEKDIRWDYFQASGKGGQSVNTTYSAVRLVHLPTGISVSCQNERNQTQNKEQALKYLKNKLAAIQARNMEEFKKELRGEFHSAEWGSQIRNYVLHPYKLVKDLRSGWESNDPMKVLEEGDLLPIIWSVKHSYAKK